MKTQDIAYVLHRRPYQNTSFLIDFYTQNHGVVTAVGRGVRQAKKKPPLECFIPFWIEYGSSNSHQNGLVTLYQYEPDINSQNTSSIGRYLVGNRLYCGLYLNELLVKLLGKHDSYPAIFLAYQQALNDLSQNTHIEKVLRKFEFFLLQEIGYGIPLEREIETHQLITPDRYYYYKPSMGFTEIKKIASDNPSIFSGTALIAIGKEEFSEPNTLKEAKRLMRLTLDFLLERHGKLKSRELFMQRGLEVFS